MTVKFKSITMPLSLFCLFGMIVGCGLTAHQLHPGFEFQGTSIRGAVLIPPDVRIYELSSHGLVMLRNDWSAVGRNNLQQAVLQNFVSQTFAVKPLAPNSETAQELAEVKSLYKLVNRSLRRHTFGPLQVTDKNHGFKYSLGSLEDLLEELNADSLIFVSGSEHISNRGRKALIDLAIADSSGAIVFYAVIGSKEGNDLRDPRSADIMIHDLLSSFPKAGV